MTSFKNNFSRLRLLANKNISFWDEKSELRFEMIPLKVEDLFFDERIAWFINLLETDMVEIQKSIQGYELKDHYDFLNLICILSIKDEDANSLKEMLLYALDKLIPGLTFKDKTFKINDYYFTKSLFEEVTDVLFKILDKERIVIKSTDDEFTRREKEAQLRAQRIRSNAKKDKEDSTGLEDLFAALLYEFPQYKIEDLFGLNIYTFYYLFRYVGKIANYEVSKIAYGNGLLKKGKHKHFIEN